jgi:hypothetical protein
MAGIPQLGASIDFANGPAFIPIAFTLGDPVKGKLGTGRLADADDQVDISDIILRSSIRRGRNRILNKFEAGTAVVEIKDDNGDWNPANTASPYYGKLIPLRKIQIWADYEGVRYYLYSGFITSYDTTFAIGADEVSRVILNCVDGFRLLNNAAITSVPDTGAGQLSGTRINKLLDVVDWPQSQRDINDGDSTMQADPGTADRTVLEAIQTVENSEFGGFFLDAEGNATFYSRTTVSQYADSTPVVFSDDGTGIGYAQIDLAFDDTLIVNDVSVQRLNGTNQTVTDQTSIDNYFKHSGARTGILVQTDTESLNQATMILNARKDATVRIDSMTLNLVDDGQVARNIAGIDLEIFDLVIVTKSMPGSTSITKELFVQGLQHDITRTTFTTKILTSEPIIQAFIIGSEFQGILGVAGVLSY